MTPVGHDGSIMPNSVHFCEHSGLEAMLIVFVQTPLAHSVDMSLAVVHGAPNPLP
jgi:hypothetical protein